MLNRPAVVVGLSVLFVASLSFPAYAVPPNESIAASRVERDNPQPEGPFASQNVILLSWLDLPALGALASGNDCWGYVSPSGREYALMGVDNLMVVVEVTDPVNPVIIGNIAHPSCLWGDVKVYQDVAYVVTDVCNAVGIQVVDLSGVDSGSVSLIRTIGLPDRSHNVVVNEDSGYLYTTGSSGGSNVTVIYDLTDPTNPQQVGTWGTYEHDAQVITYTTGPNAGREIMFGASEGRGLDVVDVTNKSNTFLVSRTPYPGVAYCHQVWTEDLQYAYINDELDGIPRTIVFDISNLSNPVFLGSFSSGTGAIDHNNYVLNGIVYAANYKSGLRIFDTNVDPVNAPEVAWFDTYPPDDSDGFDGAWSCYPYLPSGNILISDINRGLFVVRVDLNALTISYPSGRPETVPPNTPTPLPIHITGTGAPVNTATVTLHTSIDGGPESAVTMTDLGHGDFEAPLPATDCSSVVTYYVTAENTLGSLFADPIGAPATTYSTLVGQFVTLLSENFETDTGWIASNMGAVTGDWERGVPVNDFGWDYDPASDSDGSGRCYLTQNQLGNSDVDEGSVILTSPTFDMSSGGMTIRYDYFLRMTDISTDRLLVEINTNNGVGPWTGIALHNTDGGLSWRTHEIDPDALSAAGVTPTAVTRLRFTANDSDPQSIVEAGLDAFTLVRLECNICQDPCDDGDVCTNSDVCVAGSCVGTPVDCVAAGDACNVASCDPSAAGSNCSVLTPVADGMDCDDNDPCSLVDTCLAGVCMAGMPPDCFAAGDECNVASCSQIGVDGNCDIITPMDNGTACSGGVCTNGVCGPPLCVTVADCGDVDADGIIDDVCMWHACDMEACVDVARVFGDAGGPFGDCPPDGFANIHDRNHALACFSGTSPCELINHDLGGPFGDCPPDGFCNLHDANHALAAFSGETACSCPPGPMPNFAPQVVATASIRAVADRRAVKPGGEIAVRLFVNEALGDLRSYQLDIVVAGGRRGQLELVDAAVESRDDEVFAGAPDRFDAFNVESGQMLAGLNGAGVATRSNGYLATFTFRASYDAVGAFVVDVPGDGQTFLIASSDGAIDLAPALPAVIVVTRGDAAHAR